MKSEIFSDYWLTLDMRVEDFRPARKRSSTDWQDLLDLISSGTVRISSSRGGGNQQAEVIRYFKELTVRFRETKREKFVLRG
jgi:hypothetical protein